MIEYVIINFPIFLLSPFFPFFFSKNLGGGNDLCVPSSPENAPVYRLQALTVYF